MARGDRLGSAGGGGRSRRIKTSTTKSYNGEKTTRQRPLQDLVRCTLLLVVLLLQFAVAVAYFRPTAAPFDVTSTSPNTLRKEHSQKN